MRVKLCKCGCGTEVKGRYVRGHNIGGNTWPKRGTKKFRERSRKASDRLEKRWSSLSGYEKTLLCEKISTSHSRPKRRRETSRRMRGEWKEGLRRSTFASYEFRSKQSVALKKAYKDPEKRARIKKGNAKAWRGRRGEERRRKIRLGQIAVRKKYGKESKFEWAVRNALCKPHEDIPMFGWRWDICFRKRKTLLELQGCSPHGCRHATDRSVLFFHPKGRKDIRSIDRRKRRDAEKHGWRVVYLWEHDLQKFLEDPKKWVGTFILSPINTR